MKLYHSRSLMLFVFLMPLSLLAESGPSRFELRSEIKSILEYLKQSQIKSTTVQHISKSDYDLLVSVAKKPVVAPTLEAIGYDDAGMPIYEAPPAPTLESASFSSKKVKRIFYDSLLEKVDVKTCDIEEVKNNESRKILGFLKLKGEWACELRADKDVLLLGKKGSHGYDSNNFTATMIHNNIAKSVLNHPELLTSDVGAMLDSAYDTVITYQEESGFNFWPKQPKPLKILPNVRADFVTEEVRRPTQFPLNGNYVNKRADVANDADDTALAYETMLLNNKIKNLRGLPERARPEWQPARIGSLFSPWVDSDRKKSYPYNRIYGNYTNTGAFLTWLTTEKHGFWSVLWDLEWDTTGIHGGLNDLDCVVNANVLSALASYNELDTPGVEAACAFINKAASDPKDIKTCGIYYPNPYHLHYAAGRAFASGARCLKPAREAILASLLAEQTPDGSWPGGSTNEPVQSALYAVNALLYLTEEGRTGAESAALEKGISFIRKNAQRQGNQISWAGGVFFGGGFLIRDKLIWRSEAYSTSLGLTALSNYLKSKK